MKQPVAFPSVNKNSEAKQNHGIHMSVVAKGSPPKRSPPAKHSMMQPRPAQNCVR